MELISGLLLTLVVLGIIGVVGRELMVEGSGPSMKKYLGDSTPTDLPMLGKRGTVEESPGDLMRVRIEGERWSASPVGGTVLPAGTPIRVIAVNGLVLEVEAVIEEERDIDETSAQQAGLPETVDAESS